MKDNTDNPDFKRWLADTVFGMTYDGGRPPAPDSSASAGQAGC
jgi:hypothetical protein